MARYIPGNTPAATEMLPFFIQDELSKVAQATETPDQVLLLDPQYAAPGKARTGTIAFADGTTWNPGSGAGVYCYYASAWHFLG